MACPGAVKRSSVRLSYNDPKKQHFEDMLRSLLSQLYHESPKARSIVNKLFDSHSSGTRQPSTEQMEATLESVLEQSEHTSIVLDALDEAQSLSKIVRWCQAINSSKVLRVRMFVTSRTQVVNWSNKEHVISLGLESVSGDIKDYTRYRLNSGEFDSWASQQTLRDEVETTIGERAGGM
jgi:hypothetical protein